MLGTIMFINPSCGMFAIQLDDGSFTISEHVGSCNLVVGQRVRGPLDSHGCETLYNIDEQEYFDVSNELCEVSADLASKHLARFS